MQKNSLLSQNKKDLVYQHIIYIFIQFPYLDLKTFFAALISSTLQYINI